MSRAIAWVTFAGGVALSTGCDLAAPVGNDPPSLRLLASYPAAGDGYDCPSGDVTCGVPLNAVIELRFDRFLLPRTAVRQSIRVYSGSGGYLLPQPPQDGLADPEELRVYVPNEQAYVLLHPEYDPLERVVSYHLPAGFQWESNRLYHVDVHLPIDEADNGFRAIDGTALSSGEVPLEFGFYTGSAAEAVPAADPAPSCRDVLEIFHERSCAASDCHAGAGAALGLRLASGSDLAGSAIRHVAVQTDNAPVVGQSQLDPLRFGIAMPVIWPGRPDTSYLVYKLLLGDTYGSEATACQTQYRVPLAAGGCAAPTAAQRASLSEWFGHATPMPPAPLALGDLQELRTISGWIRAGALLNECQDP